MAKMVARASRPRKGRKSRGNGKAFGSSGPICSLPPPGKKTYRFERTIAPSPLGTTLLDQGRGFSFTLGSFPGATEFTQLFDLYRMTSLEVTFALNVISAAQFMPVLHMLADYDTYTVPATFDTVLQRPHKRVALTAAYPSFTFRIKPRVLAVVQTSSGTASSALVPASQWMDCNDSTVVYGGLVGWIENYNTTTATTVVVTVRGLFDFAMVR